MPVLKIYFNENLEKPVRLHRLDIQKGLENMMRNTLKADPDKCEILMISTLHATPKPVYVDMQFRANEHRNRDVVSKALHQIADILTNTLGTGLRIRAFDIDQAGLHALDTNGADI